MMTNELREKIEQDLYEGMYMTVNVYWKTIYDTAERYIDEIDDDDWDTFMKEIRTMTAVEFAKAMNKEYDKIIKSKEES